MHNQVTSENAQPSDFRKCTTKWLQSNSNKSNKSNESNESNMRNQATSENAQPSDFRKMHNQVTSDS